MVETQNAAPASMIPILLARADLDRLWLAIFADTHPRAEGGTDTELRARLEQAFHGMHDRDVRLLLSYFTVPKTTYKQVGAAFGISVERSREISARALRILRHPSRSRPLRGLEPLPPPKPFEITDATYIRDLVKRGLLGARAGHALMRVAGERIVDDRYPVATVSMVRHVSDASLLKLRNFGPVSLAEVRRVCGPFESPELPMIEEMSPAETAEFERLGEALRAALIKR